jgi:predicted Zn-dependent protease
MFTKLAVNSQARDFEREADYVGLYLTARAGIPIDDAPKFWRRMAVANPASTKGGFLASHPPAAERFLALEATVAEIKSKLATGEPLLPVASR